MCRKWPPAKKKSDSGVFNRTSLYREFCLEHVSFKKHINKNVQKDQSKTFKWHNPLTAALSDPLPYPPGGEKQLEKMMETGREVYCEHVAFPAGRHVGFKRIRQNSRLIHAAWENNCVCFAGCHSRSSLSLSRTVAERGQLAGSVHV